MEVDQGECEKRQGRIHCQKEQKAKKINILNNSIKLHQIFKEVMVRSLKNLVNAH